MNEGPRIPVHAVTRVQTIMWKTATFPNNSYRQSHFRQGGLVPLTSTLNNRRILLVAEYIAHGGTRTYFQNLVDFYVRQGASIVAITTHEHSDDEMAALFASLGQTLLRYSDAVANFSFANAHAVPAVWRPRRYKLEKAMFARLADHYQIDQVVLSVGTSGLLLSAAHARPNPVLIAHGYPHGLRQRLMGKPLHRRRVPHDLTLVTVSDFSTSCFARRWRLPIAEVALVTVHSTCGPVLRPKSLATRDKSVLTAALLDPYKNPFDWIAIGRKVKRALGIHMPLQFTWIGDGPLLDEARKMVCARDDDFIIFPGWVDNVSSYYDRARVYLQTSAVESLGLSVVDALRHGVPSVVANSGGLPEVVDHEVTGFVYPAGDIAAAAGYVEQLLTDDALWERQSASARLRYEERFSLERWTNGLLEAHERR